jgi:hypothetical protein
VLSITKTDNGMKWIIGRSINIVNIRGKKMEKVIPIGIQLINNLMKIQLRILDIRILKNV